MSAAQLKTRDFDPSRSVFSIASFSGVTSRVEKRERRLLLLAN